VDEVRPLLPCQLPPAPDTAGVVFELCQKQRPSLAAPFAGVTRERFKKLSQLATTAAVNGLSRYLAQQGQIKNRLGHENIQSTMVYLHMDLASKQAVQKKFVQYATSALKLDPKLDALNDWDHKQDILSWLDSL
jgi:hypothetical protein